MLQTKFTRYWIAFSAKQSVVDHAGKGPLISVHRSLLLVLALIKSFFNERSFTLLCSKAIKRHFTRKSKVSVLIPRKKWPVKSITSKLLRSHFHAISRAESFLLRQSKCYVPDSCLVWHGSENKSPIRHENQDTARPSDTYGA